MDPKLIKEVLSNKSGDFPKPEIIPLVKLFATGLATYEGQKWSKHRRIINPAFHMEKLKVLTLKLFIFLSISYISILILIWRNY